MSHVVLLGDSIFDNASYVPGGPPVLEQLRASLPSGWRATLLAVDGAKVAQVVDQQKRVPADASHLVVSAGGNDALGFSGILSGPAHSATEIFSRLSDIHDEFRRGYRTLLNAVLSHGKSTLVCTIYDAVPGLERNAKTGLMGFNDSILREAFAAGLPVIDLRLVCTAAEDYSAVSPIEPSAAGGEKISQAIARVLVEHDFSRRQTAVYGS